MTVSTTTDPLLDLVDLTVNLLPLPFAKAPPDPFVQSPSETLRTAAAVGDDVAPDPVAPDHEAETAACPLPVEESLSDARRAMGGVEGGGVRGAYWHRRYETADGLEGPSAFFVHVGG